MPTLTPRRWLPFALVAALATTACHEETHSADWYMAHSAEHQAKLQECKKYPSLNQSDPNCRKCERSVEHVGQRNSSEKHGPAQPTVTRRSRFIATSVASWLRWRGIAGWLRVR